MPMSNRDNFQWRPNDNSVTTNLRYDLEAKHWMKAFNSASLSSSSSGGSFFMVIGLLISMSVNIITLIVLGIVELIKWIVKLRKNFMEKKQLKFRDEEFKQGVKRRKKEDLKFQISKLKLPKVNLQERGPGFKKAAHFVVQKKEISITMLMLELKLDFESVCKLIDELRLAGIISKYNYKYKNKRKVLIQNKDTLNLLFEIENESG